MAKRDFHIYVDAYIEEDAIDPFEIVVPDNNENGNNGAGCIQRRRYVKADTTKSQARDYCYRLFRR